jgi:hypothetical protein
MGEERWQGLIGDGDIHHATASAVGSPEQAIEAAMAMARLKYWTPDFDWTTWDMRAEQLGTAAQTVHFKWESGTLVHIPKPPDRRPPVRARRQ